MGIVPVRWYGAALADTDKTLTGGLPLQLLRIAIGCLGVMALSGCSMLANMDLGPSGSRGLAVTTLRCEYLENPLAVASPQPRLGWVLESGQRGTMQAAYRILVADSREALAAERGDLWDSGKVESGETAHIEYAGKPLASGQDAFWKVQVWSQTGEVSRWSQPASWRAAFDAKDLTAKWIGVPVELPQTKPYPPQPPMMVRKEFELTKPIKRALVTASALGVYELQLNSHRVGDQLLAPEWTSYGKHVQYQTYDVTRLVKQGPNATGATVGEGWYAGKLGISFVDPNDARRRRYGDRLRLLAQIDVTYEDGTSERIATDESWKGTTEGPVRNADILDGESYDARKEMPGWDRAGFDESAWKKVDVQERVAAKLVPQMNEPIRVTQTLKPVKVTEPSKGVYVVDFGQNLTGRCRIKLSGQAGQTIALRHVEVLNPDGTIYRTNLRINMNGPDTGARQKDEYTVRGGARETWAPSFTYHGFRYVEVTGLTKPPAADFIVAEHFHSAPAMVGSVETSSPMLNRLMQNIQWTQRDNMHSIPTDCPQRDERMGWTGDILAFGQTACFNMDMAAFFTKWLRDMRDDQADDGRFPDYAPHPYNPNQRMSGVPAWGDAGVFVPWYVYLNYGDKRLLAEHFEAARRWVDWIHGNNPDLLWKKGRNNDYGDWLNGDTLKLAGFGMPEGISEMSKEVLGTAFFQRSTLLVSKMAAAIGKTEEASRYGKLAADIKAAFNKAYVQPDARIGQTLPPAKQGEKPKFKGNTQSDYALALDFDLLPAEQRPKAVEHVIERIHAYKDHISTGFHTTARIMNQLTAAGHADIAYMLVNNRTIPSWGYEIDHGATTIWERWDGWVEGRGFQDPGMNSFNHYSIGAVGEWMYRTILGINPDEERPGYAHIILRPVPGGGLTWAKGGYDSIRGKIATEWQLDGDVLNFKVTIPANTTATLYLPAAGGEAVTEGGKPAAEAQGVKFVKMDGGAAVYELGSGTYQFSSKGWQAPAAAK